MRIPSGRIIDLQSWMYVTCPVSEELFSELHHVLIVFQEFATKRTSSCGDRYYPTNVNQRRPMRLLERQRGAVANVNGVARPIRSWLLFWKTMFVITGIVLIVFSALV